jgi:nicotinamidase-related amidase
VKREVTPASQDEIRVGLLIIDAQDTFCRDAKRADLHVQGAFACNQRIAHALISNNIAHITAIEVVLEAHMRMQIFHPMGIVDKDGNHPEPNTRILPHDAANRTWRLNPEMGYRFGKSQAWLDAYLRYYTTELARLGRDPLTIWNEHGLLGTRNHALDSEIDLFIKFFETERQTNRYTTLKGMNPFTECYSALGPEVLLDHNREPVGVPNMELIHRLVKYDILIAVGHASSHCFGRSVEDLLFWLGKISCPTLTPKKIYVVRDCTAPVVIPSVIDFTDQAEAYFAQFAETGVNIVESNIPMKDWPNMKLN